MKTTEYLDTLKQWHKDKSQWYFTQSEEDSGFIQQSILPKIAEQENAIHADIIYIYEYLSWFYLDRGIFQLQDSNNQLMYENSLGLAWKYAYITLTVGDKLCGCLDKNPAEEMPRAGRLLDLVSIFGDIRYLERAWMALVKSIEGKSCLIRRGTSDAMQAWFSMELVSHYFQRPLETEQAYYPVKFSHYTNVLNEWDTLDLQKVDNHISLLAELHISTYVNDEDTFILVPFLKIFPYEILTWLKLRELKGLKNPKTFTHPLMNTPIAKMFLNIKEPLLYPQELPYAKELLEKLKEQCPDVEIPEWLDGSTTAVKTEETKEEKHNQDNIIPDDFFVQE